MVTSMLFGDVVYSCDINRLKRHYHNAYEIIYILSGQIRIDFKQRSYEVGPKSLVFISNLEEHSVTILKAPYARYYVTFSPLETDRSINHYKLLSVFKNRPASFRHVVDVSPISDYIERQLHELYEESNNRNEFTERMVNILLQRLLIATFRCSPSSFPIPTRNTRLAIYDVQTYIDTHFSEPITIQGIADLFFISVSYLTHCFKEATGYSPKQYLMMNRLSFANDLVIHSNLPISEIAFRSGFSDVNNFIRSFSAAYNCTPSALRKQNRPTDA